MQTYKDLIVWQKGVELACGVFLLTKKFPKEELYGITSQMRRSAVSISSNIAEGKLRGSKKEFQRFLLIAYGSGGELETQLLIAKRLKLTNSKEFVYTEDLLSEIMKMLNRLLNNLKAKA